MTRKLVGYRIAEDSPVFRHLLAQEFQGGSAEVVVGRVAAVAGHVLVHWVLLTFTDSLRLANVIQDRNWGGDLDSAGADGRAVAAD
jgi:hypothetical protein